MKIADTSAQDIALAPRDPRRKWLLLAGIAILAIALVAVAAPWVARWASATVSVPYERVRTATVQRGDLVRDVSVQGRVVAAVSPTLYASAAGTITLNVQAGEQVVAGQVLATVDSPELTNQLQQGEASLAQRKLELDRQRIQTRQQALERRKAADLAEVAVIAARREKRRAEQAREKGVIPEIDYEKAQDDLQNAELAYEHAVADADLYDERLSFELRASAFEVNTQELVVEDLRRQVGDLSIKSPVDGIVGDLLLEQKAAVSRDMPVMAVVDLTRFEIDAMIPESYADDLAIGMNAEITVGGQTYDGQLVAVSPEVVNNQVASRIRFADNGPTGLRQNQRLTTRILLAEHADVLMVQRGQFLDSGGGRLAYVVSDDRVATRRQIETGAYSLGAVEILSGLEPGETIVISNLDPFRGADTVLLTD
ncbi:MAG: HlyD family efflux transporter periplasmic adaptor subunit [Gammaproteobacteria bacterium]|nr:HlyD family efflux transporter periplasmic adaptor subunit [Gammaproteobacteria bacterium]MBT8093303.1 HlyD family efflux transporter periplasmic adaptor subunit [Gammaproteobacteria bacterium]NNF48328.1 HlyD family efflux transporter periplasmic adaptor subunit [Woeseiaceae bacterium]NNL63780.1 HlyD family efflux transporter periplasmic adaptor subunit [Woeseiaceae bacterium]